MKPSFYVMLSARTKKFGHKKRACMTCSTKKQIVLGMIDVIRKKDGTSRNHVARELDLLMTGRKSTVSKVWKNWMKTGKVV